MVGGQILENSPKIKRGNRTLEITRNYFKEGQNSCVELCARRDSNPEPSDP